MIEKFPRGVVTPPPSKSLTHRAVVCAGLARDRGSIGNFSSSADIEATIGGMRALRGAEFRVLGESLIVTPRGSGAGSGLSEVVDCAESGSTLRFLLPIAALDERRTTFTGRGRLLGRPLGVYERVFLEMGARFARTPDSVTVSGRLRGGVYSLPGDVSSQFVSGLMMALPLLDGDSEIRLTTALESGGYVGLTMDVMRRFGVDVRADGSNYLIRGGSRYRCAEYRVEADYSQAAFFLAAAALGLDVEVAGLNPESLQGDREILRVLRDMGADVEWSEDERGRTLVSVSAGDLEAVTLDASGVPDLVPPVAVLCCFCRGTSRIVNAGRLRMKESDRLRALASELRALGASVEEPGDSLAITGAPRLRGGRADAWGDHRIAMSMAVAAIRCDEPVALSGWRSVGKSYPRFWEDFERDGS
ncbi:MAG: 3-phosphoshikimate 1-carboxyvinyltransferase [Synergistaceae bacterium]|nr:3-phosphoshikimate 1-carboxyvinyltransferase [Synergistaceae bacterium]